MPRYPLIIRHSTYMLLYQEAARRGKSLGKLLNEILDDYAGTLRESGQLPLRPICIVCGRPAVFVGFGAEQQKLFVCTDHRSYAKKLGGMRRIGETP